MPVAVDDAAAAGRQLQRARVAALALALVEVGADDLDVDRAPSNTQNERPMQPTRNFERHGGVFDASSGLVE
jgi:hypothetical protein